MKTWIPFLFFLLIVTIVFSPLSEVSAQQTEEDFRSEKYARAISQIVDQSAGKLDKEAVIQQLLGSINAKVKGNPSTTLFRGDLMITPMIDFVEYDGSDSARFSYFTTETLAADLILDFENGLTWVDTLSPVITDDSIKIDIDNNPTHEARLASFSVEAQFAGDTSFVTVWILQEPLPQKIIYVSPKYLAIPPEGAATSIFTINYFNIAAWEAVIPVNWITIKNATHNVSPDSISFNVQPNSTASFREAYIKIRESGNPAVIDSIHIYQYAGSQQFLIASPPNNYINHDGGNIEVLVFSNVAWTPSTIENPGNMITSLIKSAGNDSLKLIVSANLTANPRIAKVKIEGGNPVLRDTIQIYQAAAYIILNPREQAVACEGSTFDVDVLKSGVSDIILTSKPAWINNPVIGDDNIQVTVQENPTTSSRSGYVVVSNSTNSLIKDSVLVAQYSCSQPYILLSPREQIANWDATSLATAFAVNSNEINELLLEDDAGWLTATFNNDSTSVLVTFTENLSTEIRTSKIKVLDASDFSNYDSVKVVQQGKQTYILIDPSFQSLDYDGGETSLFSVLTLNIDAWEVDIAALPQWITGTQIFTDGVIFNVAPNENSFSRQTTFFIRDLANYSVIDSAIIYQKAAPAAIILASPREQAVSHEGNPAVVFQVDAVNVETWEVDLEAADWLSINTSGADLLSLDVSENTTLETRIAVIRIFDTSDPAVADTVYLYQYAALDTMLLAAPREQWVSHTGNENLIFDITSSNVQSWNVETATLPDWISNSGTSFSQLILKVNENETLSTRQAMVRLVVDEHPEIYDSVFVYQFSALDTFLLASPREQMIGFPGNENVEFGVTSVNVTGWQVDSETVPAWIIVDAQGGDTLKLDVSQNTSLQTRIAHIRIFAQGQENIEDFVSVYQFAGPDTYLLASPREQRVVHTGNDAVDFKITKVNIAGWDFGDISSYEEWIAFENIGDSIMRLSIDTNTLLQSRQAQIPIYATDNFQVTDTVSVFQYSSLDAYLLAAPREHRILFTDTIVNFDITAVNVEELWETEIISGNGWIQVLDSGSDLLQLGISENDLLETRIGEVRIFAPANPGAADTISVFQFSAPDPALLLSPREQWVVHTGNMSLDFDVTAVNVPTWTADENIDWITVNPSGQDVLSLNVDENTTLETRVATVYINDITNPEVRDSVMVYQYSALDSCILASPREQFVSFTSSSISFNITTVNVNSWVVNTALLPNWIELGNNSEDTLHLNILLNPELETRNATVHLYDPGNPETRDSVDVFQFAAVDPYILTAPREKRISHLGNADVDFDVTLVNIDEWEFSDTTVYQEWIDFRNLGNKLQLSIDTNNQLGSRYANIVINAVNNPAVKDSVSIYQYSALDQYILMEPREQLAKRYSGDTLYFKVTRVNVGAVGFEVFDEDQMIDLENTSISNDTLAVFVKLNSSPNSRQAFIKVFDTARPELVSDTVSVYQNFPYIILRPSAIDSLVWTDTVKKINTYSNVAEYTVSKSENLEWYQISKDSADWSNASLTLAGNDQFFMRVDSNNNSYLRRSSFLSFKISDEIATEFWFDQNTRPGKYYPVKGNVFIQNDPQQPLSGVSIVLYDSILKTNNVGIYEYQKVPENWIGTITPLIDTSWAIPYYFLPPRIEIAGLGIIDTTLITPFAAYKIDPAVTLAPKSTAICFGQMLLPGDPGYPTASITDTYGSSTYHWTADNHDSLLALNPDILTPEFMPKITTTYHLEVNNFFRTAVDSFQIIVNQLPEEFSFSGETAVCRSQSGVIYQVIDPKPGVYYKWELDSGNPGGVFANSSFPFEVSGNIAVVNWGENQGNYNLHLVAYNQFDCPAAPLTKTIEITNTQAPPPTTVLRKENDNLLYCSDSLAKYYEWGWLQKNTAGELVQEFIIPGKNDWYCRLPDGHAFNPSDFIYFVIAYYDENSCGSRSFFNPPVAIDEIPDDNISVFPNPGNGIFTIRFGSQVISEEGIIGIYNASGQMIHQQNLVATKNEVTIDLNRAGSVKPGIYLLVVRTPENLLNYKIVIR